jgi:hypothetical protein
MLSLNIENALCEHIGELTQSRPTTDEIRYTIEVEKVAHLSSILLAPSEYTTLSCPATHQKFHLLRIHALCLLPVCDAVSIFKVNPMFVK